MTFIYISGQMLKERIERLTEKSSQNESYTSDSEFSQELMDIRKDLVTIHGQMVLLKNYSSLNFAGRAYIYLLCFFSILSMTAQEVAIIM